MEKITKIDGYYFRKKRLINHYTLEHLSSITKMHSSYLNKIEKEKIIPSQRKLLKLLHIYNVKIYEFEQSNFSTEYFNVFMKKLYYMKFYENNHDYLLTEIKKNKNSRYIAHLDLINCCYKMLYAKEDQNFKIEEKLIFEYLQSFEPFEQEFFLLCEMIYHARKRDKDIYNQCLSLLNKIKQPQWLGLKLYAELNANFYFQNLSNFLTNISLCKKKYFEEKNQNRYNSTLLFEAMFYHKINCLDKAIQTYEILSTRYHDSNDLNNYGICQHNIGSLYSERKEFKLAINHYENAIQHLHENDTFFELAWCYYQNGNKKNCKKSLNLGLKTDTQYTAYTLLIKWLLIMLDSPNSKRSLNILLKIEKEYFDTLGPNAQKLLYIAISNYYTSVKDFQKSNEYLKKLSTNFVNSIIDIN